MEFVFAVSPVAGPQRAPSRRGTLQRGLDHAEVHELQPSAIVGQYLEETIQRVKLKELILNLIINVSL